MRRFIRAVAVAFLLLLGMVALYGLASVLLGAITLNADAHQPAQGIPIYFANNGVHIDLVVPLSAECHCDARHAPALDVLAQPFDMKVSPQQWHWLALGWGDRQFMLSVPTWNELTPGVALRAVTGLDGSVVRIGSLRGEPQVGKDVVRMLVTPTQYRALLDYVRASAGTRPQEQFSSLTGPEDRFYGSRDHYSLFNTCNEWLSRGLAQAGLRTPLWTPSPGPLLRAVQASAN